MDGHNPLGIHGSKLKVNVKDVEKIMDFFEGNPSIIRKILSDEFTQVNY